MGRPEVDDYFADDHVPGLCWPVHLPAPIERFVPALRLDALDAPGFGELVSPAFFDDVGVRDEETLGRSL